jgi:hypothetical protein
VIMFAQTSINEPAAGTVATATIQDGAVTSAKLDTNIVIAGTLGVTGAITSSNAKFGVWSDSGAYSGIFHTSHASSSYGMLFDATNTFVGSGTGGSVYIRYDNNASANQLVVNSSGWSMGSTVVMDGSRNLVNIGTISSGATTMTGLTITAATPSIQMTDSDNNADAYIQATDGNIRFYADDNNEAADSIVTFNIDGSERMRSAGNNLHLNGGIDARIQLGTGGAGANQVSNNTVHIRGDGADMKLMAASGGIFQFEQNGTERLRIQSGGGISFNGDTAAANALDDYEEGTHTATITCSVSGTVTLYSDVNKLNYVKIGKMVHIQGMLTASAVSSPSGYFTVSLPFNISSWGGVYAGRGTGTIWLNTGSSNNVADYVVLLVQGESSARVYLGDNTGVQSDSANNIGANDDIYVGLTYISN